MLGWHRTGQGDCPHQIFSLPDADHLQYLLDRGKRPRTANGTSRDLEQHGHHARILRNRLGEHTDIGNTRAHLCLKFAQHTWLRRQHNPFLEKPPYSKPFCIGQTIQYRWIYHHGTPLLARRAKRWKTILARQPKTLPPRPAATMASAIIV